MNVRFSPDNKSIIFISNMFGPSYVFAVEVAKAESGANDLPSTPELAATFAAGPFSNPSRYTGARDSCVDTHR